ncbi:hypothetical protein CONLIGDRAFT_665979 [Coniochaeta ligniaria NRRL 30616]|uniref:Uncharacterized protein n=1 Tax=Coniochaeta ligniaria NRRL 30616 TaxID=1408157 RepID=A0A1J7J7F1_9PEZI|nr:hypothetical protein CONLIGDRAFT_665979 [Coniochaeta ligniaria NRRL 30616]
MEQLAATYSRRRNASLADIEASAVSRTLDANQWTTLTEQQNVPGFLLLDSIRFYKKATTTQSQLAPVIATLRKESAYSKERITELLQASHTYQQHLSIFEHNFQQVRKDLRTMDQQIDALRRDNLRMNSVTTRHGQDVSQLAERFAVLERELMSQRATQKEQVDLRNEIRTLVAEFSAMMASLEPMRVSLAQKQVDSSQASTNVDMQPPSPDTEYELRDAMDKRAVPRRYAVQPGQPTSDYDSNHNQLQKAHWDKALGIRPAVTYQNHPRAQSGRQAVSGFFSLSEFNRQDSVDKLHAAALQPQAPQSTSPAAEDESESERPGTETASEASESGEVATSTPPKQTRAALLELLKQAVKKHSQYPRTADNKFIWAFIDSIEDKELSKRFQMFILNRFDHRLVSKSHASMQKREKSNRFITVSKLKWPLFAQGVGEFLKRDT